MSVVACMAVLVALTGPASAGAYTTADVNTAVANGVAYIDSQQQADGHFGFSFPVAETGLAIVAYGTLDGGDFTTLSPTYQAHLKSAVSYLLSQQDPTSGAFAQNSGTDTYSTGIALEALSLSTGVDPGISAAISKGRSFLISEQNAPPAVTGNPSSPDCSGADGSGTEFYCGGWNYDAGFGRSDESNTGFALTGLAVTGGVPAASAAVNVEWQRHVQELTATNPLATRNDGGGSYEPGINDGDFSSNANDTGSLIFGYGYDGLPVSDPKVQAAIVFGQDVLDEYELMKATVRSMIYHSGQDEDGTCVIGNAGCTWNVGFDGGYHYSLWALTKGLGQYIAADFQLTDPTNWYDKVVELLLSQQGTDGSWPQDGRDDGTTIAATSFAVSALKLVGVAPDLSIIKTDSPDPVTAGDTLTYTLSVHNGGGDATGVTVTDNLPGAVSFVSATPSQGSCSQAAGTVSCAIGNLASGASATVEIKVTPQSEGTITNTASVSEDQTDKNPADNSVSESTVVTAPAATLSLSPATASNTVGSPHTVTATLTSDGSPVNGATILFSVSGANSASGSSTTNSSGQATFTYTGTNAGGDTITACYDTNTNGGCDPAEATGTASKTWTAPPPSANGRMTGGGTIVGTSVHHGFELSCDKTKSPNNLEVNWGKDNRFHHWGKGNRFGHWGKGNRFHLVSLTSAACSDDPSISEGKPVAGFDTYEGSGTGRYNGQCGATAEWVITDAGEPGRNDTFQIKITDAGGNVVLDVSGKIEGNHQAHPE